MKPGLSLTCVAGVSALMMRLAGLEWLGDLSALAYLASATVVFGRPLSKHLLATHS
jgi:hypothetical protein